jgi:hypothetical protein
MSILGDHRRWEASCSPHVNQGLTPHDIYYGGFYSYDSIPYPFPMGTVGGDGAKSKPWRDRIEKAKLDILEHESHIRVTVAADEITIAEMLEDIEEIRIWANSLKRIPVTKSVSGSTGSTTQETS